MADPKHIYETLIRATPDAVWQAITDPAFTRQYFHHTAVESSFEPESAVRYMLPDGSTAVEGQVEVVEIGRRLVITWRALYDPALAEEPPSRVEWTLAPVNPDGSVTRVTLRHFDLGLSPATWTSVRLGWHVVLDGMKTLLETGTALGDVELDDATSGAEVGSSSPEAVARRWHRQHAIDANSSAWELMDGRELDAAAAEDLLGRVWASSYHWQRATDPGAVERARAAYLCAKAHVLTGDADAALRLAERCGQLTATAHGVADFDRAFALEAEARALAAAGRTDAARSKRAAALAVEIADPEDRSLVHSDLAAEPWFGV